MKIITLDRPGTCNDCGSHLPIGTRAKYYGPGRLYGIGCHVKPASLPSARKSGYRESEPLGLTRSRYDRYGVYAHDGTHLGSTCGCEDYPCCGH